MSGGIYERTGANPDFAQQRRTKNDAGEYLTDDLGLPQSRKQVTK
jgi:hypothetical protein